LVEAETSDLVRVHMQLSYRVDFEGDPSLWFAVENYVKFLTDHLRSLLRHAVKQHGIEHFYGNAVSIIRDIVLGPQAEDGKRPGRRFSENGMRVYDVEVLDISIGDKTIADLLVEAQHATVQQALAVAAERRRLELTRARELARQEASALEAATKLQLLELEQREVMRKHEVELARIDSETEAEARRHRAQVALQELLDAMAAAQLGRERARAQFEDEVARAQSERTLRELDAQVRAASEKAKAFSPELIAALQAFGDRALAAKMAESMAPLAILGGESVADVLRRLLEGTSVADVLANVTGSAASKQLGDRSKA
jgi:major vault protein